MTTVNQFFELDKNLGRSAGEITVRSEFEQVKQRLRDEMQGFTVPESFYELLIRELADALNLDIGDQIVWAWQKHKHITKYRDQGKYPHGETHLVPLLEHTVSSKHKPTINVYINNAPQPAASISFDVLLKLSFQGAMLKIRDAHIQEVLTGSCTGTGLISYKGFAVLEKKTAPFDLPGSIELQEPIPI